MSNNSESLYPDDTSTTYTITDDDVARIKAAIDMDELTELALTLGNIPSQSRYEAESAAFVFDWLQRNGFKSRQCGATPERQNIIGEYGGKGVGKNLLFTAHLDTESPSDDPNINLHRFSPKTLSNPEWKTCWLDDGKFYGFPIYNDRGPMSCFLMAAKALKKAGFELAGKLYLTACPGEIGPEPVEQWQGVDYLGKDIGAHYLFHHGGVVADYAIAAEGSDWGVTWQGCGYVLYRIQLFGEGVFTPILDAPSEACQHPNPIYKLGAVIDALHQWSQEYEKSNHYVTQGGVSVPKVQIDAIKAGSPLSFGAGTDVCSIYIHVGLTAQQTAVQSYHELKQVMSTLHNDEVGIKDFDIEPLVVRNGFEADAGEVAPLVKSISTATQAVIGEPVARAHSVYSSMWRDQNVFNMQRVPAVTTGMPRFSATPEDLVNSALIYALTALSVCGKQ
jgi:acetylornithine deacetylase/succinyl-diaminopimelate desuccinylase-like protein